MRYIVSFDSPHHHFINIECIIENNDEHFLDFQLPSWRPGRYETANFAKNVKAFRAYDKNNIKLQFAKTTKDCWRVETPGVDEVHIKFNYYAFQLDAGACWLDNLQIYINGIHCFPFVPEKTAEPCLLELVIPDDYLIACGLKEIQPRVLFADSYDTLVDSPLIASNSLKFNEYKVNEIVYKIWIQGECKPDWEKIISDFKKFTESQMKCMEDVPFQEYHFLIQVLPTGFYHGVEHLNSTVLALGPGYNFMNASLYDELLGVASHELFHAWNIKTIRPKDMMPYDYTSENYSKLGYVYEGITTYYGDLFLLRSSVFSDDEYLKNLNVQLQKHFDNPGRYNLSVADSSFDTWLDGYVEGVPGRKTSIYTEGCIIAFILDLMILRSTNNKKSLDDAMRYLYHYFGKEKKGYSDQDFILICEQISGISLKEFFTEYVYTASSLEAPLVEMAEYAGLKFTRQASGREYEKAYGFKLKPGMQNSVVGTVMPGSPAYDAGIANGDEIVSINNFKLNNNLQNWSSYYSGEKVELSILSNSEIRNVVLTPIDVTFFDTITLKRVQNPSVIQLENYSIWSKRNS